MLALPVIVIFLFDLLSHIQVLTSSVHLSNTLRSAFLLYGLGALILTLFKILSSSHLFFFQEHFYFLSLNFILLFLSLSLCPELGEDNEESDKNVEDVDEEGNGSLSIDKESDKVNEIDGGHFLDFFKVLPPFSMASDSLMPSTPLVFLLESFLCCKHFFVLLPEVLSLFLSKSFILLNKTPDRTFHLSGHTVIRVDSSTTGFGLNP